MRNNILMRVLKNNNAQYFITLVILLWIIIFGSTITSTYKFSESFKILIPSIISTTILSVVVSSILVALPRRIYPIYPLFFTILTILLYTNSIFFRSFGRIIPTTIYSQVTNLGTMDSNMTTSLLIWSDLTSILAIVAAFIFLPRMARKIKFRPKYMTLLLLSTLILPILYWQIINIQGRKTSGNKSTLTTDYQRTRITDPYLLNLKYTLPIVIGTELFIHTPKISKAEHNTAKDYIKTTAEQNISEIEKIAENPRNLIIILVESLNSEGLCTEAMPFTYNLTQDSTNIFIPNIEDAIGIGVSMDGQLLTLSGVYPNKSQFTFAFDQQEYNLPSIIKSLNSKANYKSYLSTITDTTFWSQHIAAKAMGIENLFGSEEYKMSEWINDKMLFDSVLKNLDSLDNNTPFFYTIITGGSHGPYDHNDKPIYPLPSGLNKERGYYYSSLQRTDREIANLFYYLKNKEILEQTTIIIVSDHCMPSYYNTCACESIIPLLIVNPLNNPKYRPINNASQISIFPTILHAMGIIDSTYMGLTPSILSPRIDSLSETDFKKIEDVSMAIIYKNTIE